MHQGLPAGTVTLLFTDIEGSTRLLHDLGAEAYADALAQHRSLLREAFAGHGGVEVDTHGDAFSYVFPSAPGALKAAEEAPSRTPGRLPSSLARHPNCEREPLMIRLAVSRD